MRQAVAIKGDPIRFSWFIVTYMIKSTEIIKVADITHICDTKQ